MEHSAVHLVCGPVGAGKSTYAHELSSGGNAVVFSMDVWMAKLFAPDIASGTTVQTMNPAWFAERVDRCEAVIYSMAAEVLRCGGSVILDLGFLRRQRRDTAYAFAARHGSPAVLHYVTAEAEVRRNRVARRNEQRGQTYTMEVTPQMFDFAESVFEVPQSEELAGARMVFTDRE
ncbi:MAG: AAA family ATPase [Pseudomonas sp.]|uniref:AAA family ATPase n=1 Tax=Pseudomonas sp. TaxID=306 RepID=UPI003D0E3925